MAEVAAPGLNLLANLVAVKTIRITILVLLAQQLSERLLTGCSSRVTLNFRPKWGVGPTFLENEQDSKSDEVRLPLRSRENMNQSNKK